MLSFTPHLVSRQGRIASAGLDFISRAFPNQAPSWNSSSSGFVLVRRFAPSQSGAETLAPVTKPASAPAW